MLNYTKPFGVFFQYVNSLNSGYAQLTFEEKSAMTLLQRVQKYNWTFELCAFGIFGIMVIIYLFGTKSNVSRADKVFDSLHAYLKDTLKFARVGFSSSTPGKGQYLDQHLHTWLSSFATGRSAIESVTIRIHLLTRNNPLSLILENVVSWYFPMLALENDEEFCEIIVKPNGVSVASENANINTNAKEILNYFKFITSIVNKSVMNKSRHHNYFLSLARTTEGEDLSNEYVYMSEMNQLNGFISSYTNMHSLNELLNKSKNFLEFISFTDLPGDKPENASLWNANKEIHCVISSKIPKNKKELDLLNQIMAVVVDIYDNYTRALVQKNANVFITNDILKKTSNLREVELQKIIKAAKEIEQEKEKEEKREIDKEKRRNLKKTGEQDKIDQKMKEKRERRQKNKQRVRM